MVSFAAPLFWQISFLVANLNKKCFKSAIAELNQLIELYGEDAHGFLLGCLLDAIDFRDVKSSVHKDSLKIQLLAHEIAQAASMPNFATVISEAIEGFCRESRNRTGNSSPPNHISEEVLAQLSRLLKLNLPQQISVGLSLVHSRYYSSSKAISFLCGRLPEMATSGVQLPPDVLHSLVYLLKTHEEFVRNPEQSVLYMNSLRIAHPETHFVIELLPLTGEDLETVDMLESCPTVAVSALTSEVLDAISLADVVEDIGYGCTSSVDTFQALVHEVVGNVLDESGVAALFITLSSPNRNVDRTLISHFLPDIPMDEPNAPTSWDMDVVANVLKKEFPTIDYVKVADALDSPSLRISDVASLSDLLTVFRKCSNYEFPLSALFRKWENAEAQLSLLTAAIQAPPDVFSFEKSPNLLSLYEGADISSVPKNYSWMSVDLVNSLLELCEADISSQVMKLFESPKNICPDILIATLAKAEPHWNAIRVSIFIDLFNLYVHSRPNGSAVIRFLWSIDKKLVLHAISEIYDSSSSTSSNLSLRLFILVQSVPDGLKAVLESQYFAIALKMAIIAANKDLVSIEVWIKERIRSYQLSFVEECVEFLKKNIDKAVTKMSITPDTSSVLSIESLGVILNVLLAAQSIFTPGIVNELKNLYKSAIQAYSKEALHHNGPHAVSLEAVAAGASDDNSMNSEDIEERANAYFQRIYTSEQSIGEVIEMLKRFKNSQAKRDMNIFACMIHNLFDEYRFFHKYPEKELRITGILFGNLIQHQLVTQVTLSLALRYVLDALKKPASSKMFRFGIFALEQFASRLPEMPQYCTLLCQIPELRQACPELMQKVSILVSVGGTDTTGAISMPVSASVSSSASVSASVSVSASASGGNSLSTTPVRQSNVQPQNSEAFPPPPQPNGGIAGGFEAGAFINASLPQLPSTMGSFASFNPSISQNGPGLVPPVVVAKKCPSSISVDDIFGDLPVSGVAVAPSDSIQDRIHFIVNNVSLANLDTKVAEMREFLSQDHCDWFANYLVVKRISTQPNFHPMYLLLIEKLDQKELENEIIKKTFQNLRSLLTSSTITTNSQERSLLKNLGLWLGLFTLGRNKPLLQRQIDLKELLYVGYETGHLIAVTPFVAKILDGCKSSKIFSPPNPWVMGLMYVMREIYDVPDLKLNIKFEIEVLCKALKLKVDELQKGSQLNSRLPPPRTNNPDFNVKATPKKPQGGGAVLGKDKLNSGTDEGKNLMINSMSSESSGGGQFPAGFQETTVIPNLAAYVTINMGLALFNQHPNLKRAVPVAVDRSIREIIQPVVERSVTIACTTSRELVLKDFSTEGDVKKMRSAARLMVANLAGSLALVTCKEPLRVSMGNHLRSLLTTSNADQQSIEQVVQVCSSENLELGCMLIEKAATEKAMRDIDEALSPAYNARRRHQEQSTQPFLDPNILSPGNRYPAALPEPFRRQSGGLQPQQLLVYDSFQRHPHQPNFPSSQGNQGGNTGSQGNLGGNLGGNQVNSGNGVVSNTSSGKEGASGGTTSFSPTGQSNNGVSSSPMLSQKSLIEKLIGALDLLIQAIAKHAATLVGAVDSSSTLATLPHDNKVFVLLKELHQLISQNIKIQGCEDVILSFGQILFNRLYDLGRGDQLILEVIIASLEVISEGTNKLKKEMISWIVHVPVDEKLKLHCEILVHLIRSKLVRLKEMDVYLARHVERNMAMVEFAIHIMRQFAATQGQPSISTELPTTLEALDLVVQRLGPGNKQVAGIMKVLEQIRGNSINTTGQKSQQLQKSVSSTNVTSNVTQGSSSSSSSLTTGGQEQSLLHTVSNLLDHWIALCKEPLGNEKSYSQYLAMLKQYGVLNDEENLLVFLKASTELCVDACLKVTYSTNPSKGGKMALSYGVIDALSKLFVVLVKYTDPNGTVKLNVLTKILSAVSSVMVRSHEGSRSAGVLFDQRIYFRIFLNLLQDLTVPDQHLEPINFQILSTFASAFNAFQPVVFPGFALAWVELISHRSFLPNLLHVKQQRGWPLLHCLLIDLFVFLEPFLRTVSMSNAIRVMYKGTLRILLVLLHDFPEFLCDFHSNFCDVIPPSCIQLRNLILSAFPRNMRLPDPLSPGLQIPMLPEISKAPRLPQNYTLALGHNNLKQDLLLYLQNRQPSSFIVDLPNKLLATAAQMQSGGSKYSIPTINALVLFVGQHAITQLQARNVSSGTSEGTAPMELFQQGAAMDIFQYLVKELDPEGRYLLLSAAANHLRYPNSHTHYFSCLLLFLFSSSNQQIVKEQITRVLLERLIAHRPHPWGLLITFIEFIRNKTYKFWENKFLECSSEIMLLFDDVARSCLGPGVSTVPVKSSPSSTEETTEPPPKSSALGGGNKLES